MSTVVSIQNGDRTSALYRRLDRRLLSFLLICYLFACLDRLNVGFARLHMQSDIGLTDAQYGLAAGIFFVGYALFEVPSNLLLPRIGARKAISRILVLWGLTSAAMVVTRDATTFYALRFLLGVFEAGFTPGILFYLTCWYPESRRAKAIAAVMIGGPLAGVLGGPVSMWIMTTFAGLGGLSGWQWMYLLEGLPCVALGLMARVLLADRPETASWLSPEERQELLDTVAKPQHAERHGFAEVVKDPHVYLMSAAYFCIICGIYLINFWLPGLLAAGGVTDPMKIGLYSSIPFVAATIGMVVAGRSSDRRNERRWHSAIPALVSALSLAATVASSDRLDVSLICITVATTAMWMAYTVFWAIPSTYLKGPAAAGGIALINTIGVLGGFLSPAAIGWLRTSTGSFRASLLLMVAIMAIGAALLAATRPSFASTRGKSKISD
ncbi:MFS transporter [Burkholderia ubonensis]|uniref:MFS transporter n=1 Tax=Burkholderia ubonensis TaxID=101571 RepID=UPI00075675E9|nr:MFS transporter [Burkholderia ubonensis]KVX92582.1 MFS transporter [Burkholderia ubonensis]